MTLKYWTKRLSSQYIRDDRYVLSVSGLMLLGVIAGLLQLHLRYPLNIPGHHGLEWMALLLLGRFSSDDKKAATLLASAAALTYLAQLPLVSASHSFKPAGVFILTGIASDLLFGLTRERFNLVIKGALIGGLAFISKPVIFYAFYLLGGLKLGMFLKHPDYLPFVSHFIFGAVGGIGGAILTGCIRTKSRVSKTHQ